MSNSAYIVLTNSQFFRLITPWVSGWPGLVLERWRDFKASRPVREPTDDLAFTKMLVQHDDHRTLELVLQAVWRRPEDPTTLVRFRFRLDDAVAVGDVRLVRTTLESNEWIRRNVTPWTWFTAVAYFCGDDAILNLLKEYSTPQWTESRIRTQLFRRDLLPRAIELFRVVDVACLQWFVDHFGVACLPSTISSRLDFRFARHLMTVERLPSTKLTA